MKKTYILLLLLTAHILIAQQGRKIAFPDNADFISVRDGDTLVVDQKLYVFNKSGYEKLTGRFIQADTLASLYKLNLSISDSLMVLQNAVNMHLNNIVKIQSTAYDSLLNNFNRAGVLVDKSTANTDRALQHIKTLKMMSYFSGTVMGGVSGGFVGGQLQDNNNLSFSWTGAAVGAVTGFLINRYLLNLL